MEKRYAVAAYRIGFAAAALAAICTQLHNSIVNGNNVTNFFSFFTIQSNIVAVVVLLIGGMLAWQGASDDKIAWLRGTAALYMTMTGVIFAILLSDLDPSLQLTLPWVNVVLHYLMPVVLFMDWFLLPPRKRISFGLALWWVVYPLAYLAYSFTRGAFTDWYPYPFLNVALHGYGPVIINCLVISVGVIGLVWVLARVTGRGATAKTTPAKNNSHK
jgi:hypothetical protein